MSRTNNDETSRYICAWRSDGIDFKIKSNVFYENKIAFAIIAQVYITPDAPVVYKIEC